MTKHRCGSCRYYQEASFASSGWCHHPQRRTNSDILIMVRKNELACRDEWSRDLWEARSGGQNSVAPALVVPLPGGPVPPATDREIAAVLRADTVVSAIATNDIVLSELGGASPGSVDNDWLQSPTREQDNQIWGEDQLASPEALAVDSVLMNTERRFDQAVTLAPQSDPAIVNAAQQSTGSATEKSKTPVEFVPLKINDEERRPATGQESHTYTASPTGVLSPTPLAAAHEQPEIAEDLIEERDEDSNDFDDDVAHDNSWYTPDRVEPRRGFRFADLLPWRQAPAQPTEVFPLVESSDPSISGWRHEHDPMQFPPNLDSGADEVRLNQIEAAERQMHRSNWTQHADVAVEAEQTIESSPASELSVSDDKIQAVQPPKERSRWAESSPSGELFLDHGDERPRAVNGDPAFATPSWFPDDNNADEVNPLAEHRFEQTTELSATLDPVAAIATSVAAPVLRLPRMDTGPRHCRRCRDFRPAGDGGSTGWCANQWAFANRHVVAGNDIAPCSAAFGDWWVARDDIWFEAGDISAHGMSTPMLDAFVPSHQPEEVTRRRR